MTERPASDGREGYGAHPDEVNVRDDGKISNLTLICHSKGLLGIEWRRAGACPCRSIGLSPVPAAGSIPPIRGKCPAKRDKGVGTKLRPAKSSHIGSFCIPAFLHSALPVTSPSGPPSGG